MKREGSYNGSNLGEKTCLFTYAKYVTKQSEAAQLSLFVDLKSLEEKKGLFTADSQWLKQSTKTKNRFNLYFQL